MLKPVQCILKKFKIVSHLHFFIFPFAFTIICLLFTNTLTPDVQALMFWPEEEE